MTMAQEKLVRLGVESAEPVAADPGEAGEESAERAHGPGYPGNINGSVNFSVNVFRLASS